MKLHLVLAAMILPLGGACGTAFVRAPIDEVAPEVGAEVVTVHSGGCWSEGDAAGEYRIIVRQTGSEHLHSDLFVQWVEHTESGSRIRVTRAVPEVNDPNVWTFREVRLAGAESSWRLRVPVTNTYSLSEGEFEIELGPPGVWRVLRSAVPDTN